MTILEQAKSFKPMDRPDLTVTLFDGIILGNYKSNYQMTNNIQSSIEHRHQ